jgi:hypothetical protein
MTAKQLQRLQVLDSAYRDGCADRENRRAVSVWPWDDDPETTAAYMDGYDGRETAYRCTRCLQSSLTPLVPNVCAKCQQREHEPQGEAMRLFAPAPNQIPGQLNL